MAKRESKSPYQRYGKREFKYSEALELLQRALKDQRPMREIDALRRRHDEHVARTFGRLGFVKAA